MTVYAGRSCYGSWSRPNEATRKDHDYLSRTLFDQGHFSILEHASATFYLTGVSRALLSEFTRHRHLSFSVRSQRLWMNQTLISSSHRPSAR
ncbi:FAD-dependent thymidylate synthase, partial [Corynebacterium auriscanis]|uniref:FAD-dependent thymidylate synthase n=1 Tax=Corynebacterium auriscanis TaxID=99807 RepID=UPI003CEF3576